LTFVCLVLRTNFYFWHAWWNYWRSCVFCRFGIFWWLTSWAGLQLLLVRKVCANTLYGWDTLDSRYKRHPWGIHRRSQPQHHPGNSTDSGIERYTLKTPFRTFTPRRLKKCD